MPKISSKTAKPAKPAARTPHRTNADLMQAISAKFGAATSVVSVGFAPSQEVTVLNDLGALVAPRFNAWRSTGFSAEEASGRAQAIVEAFGQDYTLPESGKIAEVLRKGEINLPVDFPVFAFDTGLGLRRAVVLNGRLDMLTAHQVAVRLGQVEACRQRSERLATSSRVSQDEVSNIAEAAGLKSVDLEEVVAKLSEQCEVLTNALNSMVDLNVDLTQQHEDELLISFLDWVGSQGTAPNGVYIALDFHTVLNGDKAVSEIQRRLKNLAQYLPRVFRRLILAGSKQELPDHVADGLIPSLTLAMPNQEELAYRIDTRLAGVAATVEAKGRTLEYTLTDDGRARLHRAAQGLPVEEVDVILMESTVGAAVGTDNPVVIGDSLVDAVNQVKIAKLQKLGVEFAPAPDVPAGGMPALKQDLGRFKRRFWLAEQPTAQASKLNVKPPKGILIAGVTGTGKSLVAKGMAKDWGVPLLKLSIGSLYSKYVGETDQNFRQLRKLVDSCAPCIVLIDELDKALGAAVGHTGDSGTSDRLIGELLTWMQERDSAVYFVATANDISKIQQAKPELLRKGRWDQMYFVDLPSDEERAEILAVHLAAHNSSFTEAGMSEAISATASMVGAEIGYVVEAAIDIALDDGRDHLLPSDVCEIAAEVRPIALSTEKTIAGLRQWAAENAKPANGQGAVAAKTARQRRPQGQQAAADKAVML